MLAVLVDAASGAACARLRVAAGALLRCAARDGCAVAQAKGEGCLRRRLGARGNGFSVHLVEGRCGWWGLARREGGDSARGGGGRGVPPQSSGCGNAAQWRRWRHRLAAAAQQLAATWIAADFVLIVLDGIWGADRLDGASRR